MLSGNVAVTATATDAYLVTRVDFYDGSTLIGTDTTAPYSVSWNTVGAAEGTHTLTVKAYDSAGHVGTSAELSVIVDNTARIAQASNASFDALTFELWGALLHGGQLVGVSRDVALSPEEFAARVKAVFVDSPPEAVLHADRMIAQMMTARGYPMADFNRRYEDLTVDHGEVARHYRAGHDIVDRQGKVAVGLSLSAVHNNVVQGTPGYGVFRM